MNREGAKGLIKHADFILLDMLCLQISFIFAFWTFHQFSNPYRNESFRYQAAVLIAAQLAVVVFTNGYSGIIRRGKLDELIAVTKHIVYIILVALLYLFTVHDTGTVSRLQYGGTAVAFVILAWLTRLVNKQRILKTNQRFRSIALITVSDMLNESMRKLEDDRDCFVSRIFLLDDCRDYTMYGTIQVFPFGVDHMEEFVRRWVDEVLILPPDDGSYAREISTFSESLIDAGITVSCVLHIPIAGNWSYSQLKKIGSYKVFSASLRSVPIKDAVIKRVLDLLGGMIGCLLTGLLYLIVAPLIAIKSPGPVFFIQERIGRNGKPFTMYKFRTMYPDAEARKKALSDRNKIESGMMFKIDDDPRIIGSEKKDKKGRPKGIGNFLRKYSIDEFPQFYNVLRGDMSLVGWRPCTVAEWEKYDLKHRIRASMKPGITGMWQVNGRSRVIDFNEVVRMDREYIENWSIGLDLKIILKTIWVVISGRDAA